MPNEYACAYERDGLPSGLTVGEWELENKLPKYSCYPWVEHVTDPKDRGYYMYSEMTLEERNHRVGRSRK